MKNYFRLILSLLAVVSSPLANSDHIAGVGPTGPTPALSLLVGPAGNEIGIASVTFDLSATPSLASTGTPIVGTPNIIIEVGFRRARGITQTVNLDYTADATLETNPVSTTSIPISDFSWTVVAPAGSGHDQTLPAGSFIAGGPHTIDSLTSTRNNAVWMGGELTFSFANRINDVFVQGSYSGTVTFTAYIQ